MKEFPKPKVVVSRCIEFEACRYNGMLIASPIVNKLKDYVEFITVCPEVEIGLGIPREAVRLVKEDDQIKLRRSMSGDDHTEAMHEFSKKFLDSLSNINGFILKSRSPSCGLKQVKLYGKIGKVQAISSKNTGLFGQAVLDQFEELAIEDEGRLTNLHIREHFLTKLYTLTRYQELDKSMKALVKFHTDNKYLFMAYNQSQLRLAGKIVANHDKLLIEKVFEEYKKVLYQIFSKNARITSHINVLMHIFGYFSKQLTSAEKAHFLEQLEIYRNRQIPLVVLTAILQSWVQRFEQSYLKEQSYFQPFPRELMHITDSGKGRIIK